MRHNFDTAFYQYSCYLQDRLNQSASSRDWISRELSGNQSNTFILRGVSGDIIAQVQGKKVTL
tara:strand:- start:335 stop:523 length:189 start_codon:yes stop_codon:yes gene_type:complete